MRAYGLLVFSAMFIVQGCGGSGGNRSSDSLAALADSPRVARAETVSTYVPTDSLQGEMGSLSVAVTLTDETISDTTVFPIRDFEVCGAQLADNSIQREGRALGGAVAWLKNVSAGKALPVRKRFDLVHQGCLLSPRVQAAVVGGTLNVRNNDGALHVLRFRDTRSSETLARITQSERGQVVPIDYMFDVPRVIEVTCESHPWTKAWIHVFDQPYHGVTDRAGNAIMDSVPPGSYQLMVWHERFGEQRSDVAISAGVRTSAGVALEKR
jgi:hypothetical protein